MVVPNLLLVVLQVALLHLLGILHLRGILCLELFYWVGRLGEVGWGEVLVVVPVPHLVDLLCRVQWPFV